MTRTHPLSRTDIYQVVALAVRAPSIHNTQPWSIHADTDSLEVWADRNRQLPVTDPDGWALRVSCGALVFGLRLALVTYGWDSTVTLLPDSHEPDLLAHVKLTEQRVATPLEQRLGRAVPLRRSNRYPFADSPVPKPVLEAISAAAAAENCWIRTLQDRIQVVQVAELVREASQHLTARPGYQEELTSWIHDHGSDGVPRRAGGPAPEPQDLLPFRNFGGRSRAVGGEYEPWPLLAVLGTRRTGRAGPAWLSWWDAPPTIPRWCCGSGMACRCLPAHGARLRRSSPSPALWLPLLVRGGEKSALGNALRHPPLITNQARIEAPALSAIWMRPAKPARYR